jgi:hypothetical protein
MIIVGLLCWFILVACGQVVFCATMNCVYDSVMNYLSWVYQCMTLSLYRCMNYLLWIVSGFFLLRGWIRNVVFQFWGFYQFSGFQFWYMMVLSFLWCASWPFLLPGGVFSPTIYSILMLSLCFAFEWNGVQVDYWMFLAHINASIFSTSSSASTPCASWSTFIRLANTTPNASIRQCHTSNKKFWSDKLILT